MTNALNITVGFPLLAKGAQTGHLFMGMMPMLKTKCSCGVP